MAIQYYTIRFYYLPKAFISVRGHTAYYEEHFEIEKKKKDKPWTVKWMDNKRTIKLDRSLKNGGKITIPTVAVTLQLDDESVSE